MAAISATARRHNHARNFWPTAPTASPKGSRGRVQLRRCSPEASPGAQPLPSRKSVDAQRIRSALGQLSDRASTPCTSRQAVTWPRCLCILTIFLSVWVTFPRRVIKQPKVVIVPHLFYLLFFHSAVASVRLQIVADTLPNRGATKPIEMPALQPS